MLEIIIVLSVVGMLSVALFANFNNTERTQVLKAEWCISRIEGEVRNFINSAMRSRNLQIEEAWTLQQIFPDKYTIHFNTNNTGITLEYTIDTNKKTYKILDYTKLCNEKGIFLKAYPENFNQIIMNKGFQQEKAEEIFPFSLTGGDNGTLFTWEVIFRINFWEGTEKDIRKWSIDSRTQNFHSQGCNLYYEGENRLECERRLN